MTALKKTFEELGFTDVKTYINSGNVLFSTESKDPRALETKIEKVLTKEYSYPAKVVVKSKKELAKIVSNLPKNWDDDTKHRYNVIFLRHTVDSKKLLKELPTKTEDIEKLTYSKGALYWSAAIKTLTRSNMIKLASNPLYKEVTIRNLNTTRKLFELMNERA